MKRVVDSTKKGKLHPNWEGPYIVLQNLPLGAYKLEILERKEVPRTWNVTSLRHYISQKKINLSKISFNCVL